MVEPTPTAGPPEPAFDPAEFQARVGGGAAFLRELAGIFLEDSEALLSAVRAAVDGGDAAGLRRSAHTLAGLIGHFSTGGAYRAATRLEQFGRAGELAEAPAALAELDEAVGGLRSALAPFALPGS